MRPLISALVATSLALAATHVAAADCRQRAAGRPSYRVTTTGPGQPPPGEPTPKQVLAIYPDGTWTRHGDAAFGDPEPLERTGCVAPDALRELLVAVARARFRFIQAPTCAAVNDRRHLVEAPRRRKRIVTETPCGQPTDTATAALIACAALVTRDTAVPLSLATLRATCRPPR